MSMYGGNGEFSSSFYSNPKMGGKSMYGGGGMSQEQNWMAGQQQNAQNAGQSFYQPGGFDPKNPFGTTYMSNNPLQPNFEMTPGMQDNQAFNRWNDDPFRDFLSPGLRNISMPGSNNPLVWMDNGTKYIDPSQMSGMFGSQGGGVPGQYQGSGPIETPEKWGGYTFDVSQLDPNKAIESWEPYMAEQREAGFAEAGKRMGQSGMAMSTPYAEALGGVARKSTDDLARIAAEYQYRAQESMAQRDLQRQMAEQQASLGSWGTHGGWQQQGQMFDKAQDFGGWQQHGNWQMQQNAMDQQNQQNMMMALMSSFMGV